MSGLNTLKQKLLVHNFINLNKLSNLANKNAKDYQNRKILLDFSQQKFDIITKKDVYQSKSQMPISGLDNHWKNSINLILVKLIKQTYLNLNCSNKINLDYNQAYIRHASQNGFDLILNTYLNCKQSNQTLNELFYAQNKFTNLIFTNRFDKHYEEQMKKTISIILPVYERWESFKRFLTNYENICLKQEQNTRLTVILFESKSNETNWIKDLFESVRVKYSKLSNDSSFRMIVYNSTFTRALVRNMGAQAHDKNDLLFFIDVDLVFSQDVLLRIRLNTIQNRQVYFPIVLSEFNPKYRLDNVSHSTDLGYWRYVGYGMVAAYKSDFDTSGGFNNNIKGWGSEDTKLYNSFLGSNLQIFRCVDPGLKHVYHKFDCSADTPSNQFRACLSARSNTEVSQKSLTKMFYLKQNITFID